MSDYIMDANIYINAFEHNEYIFLFKSGKNDENY